MNSVLLFLPINSKKFINKEIEKDEDENKEWNAQSIVVNKNRIAIREKEEKEDSRRLKFF